MKTPCGHFIAVACDVTGSFTPPSYESDSYVLTSMQLLTNFPLAIPISDKSAEMVAQTYLTHVYATFGGFLTLIVGNDR